MAKLRTADATAGPFKQGCTAVLTAQFFDNSVTPVPIPLASLKEVTYTLFNEKTRNPLGEFPRNQWEVVANGVITNVDVGYSTIDSSGNYRQVLDGSDMDLEDHTKASEQHRLQINWAWIDAGGVTQAGCWEISFRVDNLAYHPGPDPE